LEKRIGDGSSALGGGVHKRTREGMGGETVFLLVKKESGVNGKNERRDASKERFLTSVEGQI